jgi:lipoate-protein ligase A
MDDFKALPIGAYECVIKDARVNVNEETGKKTFKVSVDIAKGEYQDYFLKRYTNNTNTDKKWDNNAVRYLGFEGDSVAFFKGFITSVENSNAGYKWNWDETTLKGKKICGVFQYEEHEKQDGSKTVKVRLNKFRSIDKMKDIEVSDSVKLLNGKYMSIDDYNERQDENKQLNDLFGDSVVEIGSENLPF